MAHGDLLGFESQEARQAYPERVPLIGHAFDWSGDNFPFVENEPQNERAVAYTSIKNAVELNESGETVPGKFAEAIDA